MVSIDDLKSYDVKLIGIKNSEYFIRMNFSKINKQINLTRRYIDEDLLDLALKSEVQVLIPMNRVSKKKYIESDDVKAILWNERVIYKRPDVT